VSQATPAAPGSLVAWSREQLAEIERQLLPLVGPMARILVRDAAATTASRQELYQLLASHLESEDERRRFLTAGGERVITGSTGKPAGRVSGGLRSPAGPPRALTPEATQYACQVLARYIGPIAAVVTRKAAQNATDEAQFYAAIAEKVADERERERFLRELQRPR
jgi:serine/threonine-protein kinase